MSYQKEKPMNLEDGRELLKVLDGKKANADSMFLYKSAIPGSVVEVEDAVAECVKQMQIEIAPVQDLHGYGKPWVGGAGKNLWKAQSGTSQGITFTYDSTTGEYTLNGTSNALCLYEIDVNLPAGQYAMSANNTETNGNISIRVNTTQGALTGLVLDSVNASKTYNDNYDIVKVVIRVGQGTTLSNFKLKPQLEAGSDVTPFAPYSNICPISGHTGCEIVRTGKNLIFKRFEGYFPNSSGVIAASSLGQYSTYVARVFAGKNYVWSGNTDIQGGGVYAFYVNEPIIGSVSYNQSRTVVSENQGTTFTAPIDGYVALRTATADENVQIELGSTATAYETRGTKYSISFPSPTPGTVYGGTLTLNQDGTGTLVVDRATKTLNGTEIWAPHATIPNFFYVVYEDHYIDNESANIAISDKFEGIPYGKSAQMVNGQFCVGKTTSNNKRWSFVYTGAADVNEWKAFLASNNVQVVYKLASSSSYDLTVDQVHLLLGYNTLYASTGSILSMLYPTSQVETVANTKADGILETLSTPSAVMSFSDGADGIPIGMEVAIEPVQDLHGYDKPWVGGAGKNIFPWYASKLGTSETLGGSVTVTYNLDGTIKLNGTASTGDNIWMLGTSTAKMTFAAGSYVGFVSSTATAAKLQLRNTSDTANIFSITTRDSFTLSEDTEARPRIRFEAGDSFSNVTIYPMIALQSTALTIDDYEPYENICPISGFDHAEVTRTGKNLFSDTITSGINIDVNGALQNQNDRAATTLGCAVKPETTYTLSYQENINCGIFYYKEDGSFDSYLTWASAPRTFTTPANVTRVRFSFYAYSGVTKPQLELGSSSTAYEAYNANKYEVSFPTSAGTVYGGTLKVNKDGSGVLVVTHRFIDFGDYTWEATGYFYTRGNIDIDSSFTSQYVAVNGKCSAYPVLSQRADNTLKVSFNTTKQVYIVDPNIGNLSTAAQIKEYLTGTKLVYELATPTTYSIPAPIIKSLLGQNNLWSSTGDINSAEWSADTKSYIDNLFSSITSAEGQTF